jgi:hypothetical protein
MDLNLLQVPTHRKETHKVITMNTLAFHQLYLFECPIMVHHQGLHEPMVPFVSNQVVQVLAVQRLETPFPAALHDTTEGVLLLKPPTSEALQLGTSLRSVSSPLDVGDFKSCKVGEMGSQECANKVGGGVPMEM